MSFVRTVCCALILTCGLLVAPAQAATQSKQSARWELAVAKHSNTERNKHHRSSMTRNACLARYAQAWAKHMARSGKLEHRTNLSSVLDACNLSWVAENIAMGQMSGHGVVNDWMRSPNHRANLLDRRNGQVGVGAYRYKGRWWTAQLLGKKS